MDVRVCVTVLAFVCVSTHRRVMVYIMAFSYVDIQSEGCALGDTFFYILAALEV